MPIPRLSDDDFTPVFWEDVVRSNPASADTKKESIAARKRKSSAHSRRKSRVIKKFSLDDDDDFEETEKPDAKSNKGLKKYKMAFGKEDQKDIPKELHRDYLAKGIFKAGYNLRGAQLGDLLHNNITDEYLQCMYIVSAYTIRNYFGKPSSTNEDPQKLTVYLNQFIPLTPKDRTKNFSFAKTIKPPPFLLNLKVIEAKDLIATDPNGLSDPFCKTWLKGQKQKIQVTKVKERTVDPEWNQSFQFKLTDVKNDIINIQIWDSDPVGIAANLKEIQNINSLRGCWFFLKDVLDNVCPCGKDSGDDFIGKTQIDLGNIYCEGVEEWLPLKDEKGGPQQGQLHVSSKFEVKRPINTLDAVKRHFLLVRICLDHGLKMKDNTTTSITSWENILSKAAETLLFQHSVQGNIYTAEDHICRFVNIIHLAMDHITFNFQFIYKVLNETQDTMNQYSNYSAGNSLEEVFLESIANLETICINFLSNLHSFDITEDEIRRTQFEFIMRCVSLCNEISGKPSHLFSSLKAEAETWFTLKAHEIENITAEMRTETLVSFLQYLRRFHATADGCVRRVFPERTYTQITYKSLDSSLCDPVRTHVIEIVAESQYSNNNGDQSKEKEHAVKVFGSLKATVDYLSKTLKVPYLELELGHFREWFGVVTIKDWFLWKEGVVSEQIKSIVSVDNLQNRLVEYSGRCEKQSNSAKQTCDLIDNKLFHLWKLVSDSKYPEFNKAFTWALHNCCMKYAECLLIGVIPLWMLAETFQTGGKKKLCAIANNLWSLSFFSGKIISEARIRLQHDTPHTKFSLQIICKILCRDISNEIKPDVIRCITQVAEASTKKDQGKSVREYVRFMTKLIKYEANSDMCFEIRLLFIGNIWDHVVATTLYLRDQHKVVDFVSAVSRVRKFLRMASNVFEGLLTVLKETERLCYFDNEGKLKEIMWNDEYKILKNDLEQTVLYNK